MTQPTGPTNTDIVVGLARLEEQVRSLGRSLDQKIDQHGHEIAELRSDFRIMQARPVADQVLQAQHENRIRALETEHRVTWKQLGGVVGGLVGMVATLASILAYLH